MNEPEDDFINEPEPEFEPVHLQSVPSMSELGQKRFSTYEEAIHLLKSWGFNEAYLRTSPRHNAIIFARETGGGLKAGHFLGLNSVVLLDKDNEGLKFRPEGLLFITISSGDPHRELDPDRLRIRARDISSRLIEVRNELRSFGGMDMSGLCRIHGSTSSEEQSLSIELSKQSVSDLNELLDKDDYIVTLGRADNGSFYTIDFKMERTPIPEDVASKFLDINSSVGKLVIVRIDETLKVLRLEKLQS